MDRTASFSIWTKLDRFPPIVCRMLARTSTRGGAVRAMSDADVAILAGMTVSQVASLSRLTTWEDVTLSQMKRFSSACGVHFASRKVMKHLTDYIAHDPSFAYLRRSDEWPKFKELMEIYASEAKAT